MTREEVNLILNIDKILPKLVGNYENRIKSFIIEVYKLNLQFQMASSNNPIKIKDYSNPVETSRKVLMQEECEKIIGRKGFIFKGFLTEKEKLVNNNII